ncbi:MAG: immunoglobulin domain-containing protein, partial [Verrucomicrobiae bacterium]|nr:immunoglobulin domain-containing protein [Verrucomicrobiae bacterium]
PNTCCMQIAEVELLGTGAPQDVTQPGDTILASSANSPGSEGVANAIDNQPTKYLNFDSGRDGAVNGFSPSGFVVTPSVGATTVIGLTMQSANDAPERDPRIVLLEGSNDDVIESFNSGTWEEIVTLEDIPDFTARFQVQEFYFPNKTSYKHYRWTVLATAAPNTCCMQIAEVELLAATTAVDCDRARFLVQPVDTLVLPDASATFFTTVNGPWPLQWHVNGEPIPGATSASYTTPPVTAANADNVYTVQIRGCEVSLPVQAVLFTPSATRSIGISFRGGGANGSPTLMNETDVAGLHPQAYWINATGTGGGFLPDDFSEPPIPVVDSSNAPSNITVEWASSGTWGSGTGDASSTQRMLNGLNHANPGTEGSITFANVPAGNHAVIAYFVGIPLQFQDADYTVTGQASETYNVRVINADEYNAAPGFYRGISKDPNNRSLATYVRFDNVQPANGVVTLTWNTLTTGFDRGAPVNAVQLILNATPAGAPPVITAQPQPSIGPAGGTASVSVTATGENLTYQWRKNGRNLPDGGNVSGATSATLSLSSLSEDDNGIYNVAIFNPGGSVVSRSVSVRVSAYDIAADLVGYWKFDESAGATAANAATGGQAGEVIGSPSWGAGRVANSLSLDGGTYVFVPSYPRAGREISVSGWVNLSETGTDVAIVRNAQGALGVGLGAGQFELGLVVNQNDGITRLTGAIGAGPNIVRVTAADAFTFGSWQHIAMSADGAQLRLFVNGTQVGSADYITAINAPAIPYLSMGARLNIDPLAGIEDPEPDFSFPNLMVGRLDDLGLWTRGLTADEVQKVFAAGQQGQPLTSVVLEPPAQSSTLTIGAAAGNITVTWDAGRLQTAPSAAGPWTDAVGTSPLTEPAGDAAKFYRTVSP